MAHIEIPQPESHLHFLQAVIARETWQTQLPSQKVHSFLGLYPIILSLDIIYATYDENMDIHQV